MKQIMKDDEIEEILSKARIKLIYTEEEYRSIEQHANNIIDSIKNTLRELNVKGEPIIAGSLAKRTMIKGYGDIDIFILLEPIYPKQTLRQLVVEIGNLVFGEGNYWMRYADHPYIETEINKYTYSVVPAYKVTRGEWISPVDRTVYHLEYIKSKVLNNRAIREDMALLKAFMRRIGVYGAEVYVKGFSGYLCELLVLYYGSLVRLFKETLNWKPPIIIDIERHYRNRSDILKLFSKSLIVIDPIDKSRNVASAVSEQSLSIYISAVKGFMEKPDLEYFNLWNPNKTEMMKLPEGTHLVGIIFSHDIEIPDIIYSQVNRLAKKIIKQLILHGFYILKWDVYSDFKTKSMILIATANISIPKVYVRKGPKPYMKTEKDFILKNIDKFIWIDKDGRWKVIDKIEVTDIIDIINKALKTVSIPDRLQRTEPIILLDDELTKHSDIQKWLEQFVYRREFWVSFD